MHRFQLRIWSVNDPGVAARDKRDSCISAWRDSKPIEACIWRTHCKKSYKLEPGKQRKGWPALPILCRPLFFPFLPSFYTLFFFTRATLIGWYWEVIITINLSVAIASSTLGNCKRQMEEAITQQRQAEWALMD